MQQSIPATCYTFGLPESLISDIPLMLKPHGIKGKELALKSPRILFGKTIAKKLI